MSALELRSAFAFSPNQQQWFVLTYVTVWYLKIDATEKFKKQQKSTSIMFCLAGVLK